MRSPYEQQKSNHKTNKQPKNRNMQRQGSKMPPKTSKSLKADPWYIIEEERKHYPVSYLKE